MGSGSFGDPGMLDVTGKVMVVAIIALFVVVLVIFFLRWYAKWFWYPSGQDLDSPDRRRRPRRLDFSSGNEPGVLHHGLDPSLRKSIPATLFDPEEYKDGLECAVCLCEFAGGEEVRFLPSCNHGFHVECIDMWFLSHSTCPLCRSLVSPNHSMTTTDASSESLSEILTQEDSSDNELAPSEEYPSFPTHVLVWGNEIQVNTIDSNVGGRRGNRCNAHEPASSSSPSPTVAEGELMIDIPMESTEDEDQKSPKSSRIRSFKRLLSWDRRAVNPCGPSSIDEEQGGGLEPKAP